MFLKIAMTDFERCTKCHLSFTYLIQLFKCRALLSAGFFVVSTCEPS